ncbi:hypothetical protein PGB90_009544 [Kerria lacca]
MVGGRTGYHSAGVIDVANHNQYEELPTLGVVGDIIMSLTRVEPQPAVNIPIIPQNMNATNNLLGYNEILQQRRDELKTVISSVGITHRNFPETIPGTRLCYDLFDLIDNALAVTDVFKVEKVNLCSLGLDGSEAQLVITSHIGANNPRDTRSTQATVQPKMVSAESTSLVGATYFTGFQLTKEAYQADNTNWCCIEGRDEAWRVPDDWVENRNERRRMPANYTTAQYAAMYDQQSYRTYMILKRMSNT